LINFKPIDGKANITKIINESLDLFILICFITFQWLVIGYAANSIYNLFRPKELKFSLNDK